MSWLCWHTRTYCTNVILDQLNHYLLSTVRYAIIKCQWHVMCGTETTANKPHPETAGQTRPFLHSCAVYGDSKNLSFHLHPHTGDSHSVTTLISATTQALQVHDSQGKPNLRCIFVYYWNRTVAHIKLFVFLLQQVGVMELSSWSAQNNHGKLVVCCAIES